MKGVVPRLRDVQALRLFARVSRLGSFSAAAREADLSQSQVSRIVADLEASLGARLFARTTRAVKLTEPGRELLPRVDAILAALDDAEASVREDGMLTGSLRVGMPSAFGIRVLLPGLAPFVDAHPLLRVEIMLDDRIQDLVREDVDVVVRVGSRGGSPGTSKLLGQIPRVVVASPRYLKKAGLPRSPADLGAHRIVVGPAALPPGAWRFERNGEVATFGFESQMRIDDSIGAVAAVVTGLGITSTTSWSCEEELARGTLVRVLAGWKLAAIPLYAVLSGGRAARKPARAFVDFLAEIVHAKNA